MGIVMSAASNTGGASAEGCKKKTDKSKEEKLNVKAIARWINSIDELLEDPDGVKEFRKFLEAEEDEFEKGKKTKYLDMYCEIQEYKKKLKAVEEDAKRICDKYLTEYKKTEIVVDGDKNKEVCKKVNNGLHVIDKEAEDLSEKAEKGSNVFDKQEHQAKEDLKKMFYNNFCEMMRDKYLGKK